MIQPFIVKSIKILWNIKIVRIKKIPLDATVLQVVYCLMLQNLKTYRNSLTNTFILISKMHYFNMKRDHILKYIFKNYYL